MGRSLNEAAPILYQIIKYQNQMVRVPNMTMDQDAMIHYMFESGMDVPDLDEYITVLWAL